MLINHLCLTNIVEYVLDVHTIFELLCIPYFLLGMCCLIPLLESIDSLVKFSQGRNVFVCNMVATIKMRQGQLFSLYFDKTTCYSSDEFLSFKNLLDCSHEVIHMKWVPDLNDHRHELSFVVNGQSLWACHGVMLQAIFQWLTGQSDFIWWCTLNQNAHVS